MSTQTDAITVEEALGKTYYEEVCVEKTVSAKVPEAFTKFHDFVWLKNAGVGPQSWTSIVAQGDPDSKEGETRKAAGVVREKILRTIPNEEIVYSVLDLPSAVPDHVGFVRFYPEGEDKTRIVWLVKFNAKFGFVLMVKAMIKSAFTVFLYNLENELKKHASAPVQTMPPTASKEEAADAESQVFTDQTSVERTLSGPVPLVFQKFREVVWLRNGGLGPAAWTSIIEEGDPETHVGETRKAAGIMQERILRIVENELIVYTVVKGPFPVHNHMGSVVFMPVEGENKTKVTWTVNYTPMKAAGPIVKGTVQAVFPIFLANLERELQRVTASS